MDQATLTLAEGLPHHLFHPHAPPISPPVRTWRMENLGLSGIFPVVHQPVHVSATDLVLHGIIFWRTTVDGCGTASGVSEHHNGGFHRDVVHKYDGLYRCRLRGITALSDPVDHFMSAYMALGTLAIYKGAWELITKPFYWQK